MKNIHKIVGKYLNEGGYSNYNDYSPEIQSGVGGYIWKTQGDDRVRHSHMEMDGKFVPENEPPTLDGMTGHAGELPNCRCYRQEI